jgi:hypothetical protein
MSPSDVSACRISLRDPICTGPKIIDSDVIVLLSPLLLSNIDVRLTCQNHDIMMVVAGNEVARDVAGEAGIAP